MRGFFRMEGPIFEFLNKMADLLILNLLFIVCCLPIVTIGASLTAMAYVSLKMRKGEEGYIWKSFFKSFKENFRQATIIWLILLAALIVLTTDFLLMRSQAGTLQMVLQILVFTGTLFWLMILFTVFPLLSRFENTIRVTLNNALLLSIGKAPRLLLMCLVSAGAVVLTLWNQNTIIWGTLLWLLFGFSLLGWLNAWLLGPVFDQLMPPEEEEETQETEETEIKEER